MKEEKGKKVGGESMGKEVGESSQRKQDTEGQTQKWKLSEKKNSILLNYLKCTDLMIIHSKSASTATVNTITTTATTYSTHL